MKSLVCEVFDTVHIENSTGRLGGASLGTLNQHFVMSSVMRALELNHAY